MIIAAYKNPTDREIWNFGSNPIKFGLLEMQGIIFILAKVGTEAWVDLPYFVDLMPHFETSDIPDRVGYLVQVYRCRQLHNQGHAAYSDAYSYVTEVQRIG